MNKIRRTIYLLLLAFTAMHSQDNITINDVEVVKAFDAKLIEAQKVSINPVIPDIDIPAPRYQYDINIEPLDLNYPDPIIRPLAMKPDERKEPKMAWLKAGYGSLKKPYVDLGYNVFIEDLYDASFFGHYEGGSQSIDDQIFRAYQNLNLKAMGKYFLIPKMSVFGFVNFDQDKRSLGITDAATRNFNTISLGGGIESPESISGNIHYQIGLDFKLIKESTEDITETIIGIPATVDIQISDQGLFSITNNFEFSKALDTYDAGITNQLNGYFKNTNGNFTYKLGGGIVAARDQQSIFPSLLFSYATLANKLNIEIGSDQSFYRYNVYGLYQANPYFLFSNTIDDVNISRKIYLGANGKIANVSFNSQAGYKLLSNIYSFVNTDTTNVFFENAQDSPLESTAIYLEGNMRYEWNNWLTIDGNLTQHFYSTKDDLIIYHLPNLEIRTKLALSGNNNKWNFYTTLQFTDKVSALNLTTQNLENLNNQFDFSLGGDYFFHKNFGLYVEANNLFSNHYERWNGYRDFGSNYYGGIKLNF